MKKIILLSILCLMLSACSKSVEGKFFGKWSVENAEEELLWEFSEDFSLRVVGDGNTDSIEWNLFEELSDNNPSSLLLLYEDGELEVSYMAEFLLDNKLLLIDPYRNNSSLILNKIEK